MLKHLLSKPLALELFWTSQILIQMIDILDLDETLMILSLNAKTILLKIYVIRRVCKQTLGLGLG